MSRRHDLVGHTFERLTVFERSASDKQGRSRWKCRCQCGTEVIVAGYSLLAGHTRSCGCLQQEVTADRSRRQNSYQCHTDYCVGTDAQGNSFVIDADDYSEVAQYYWSNSAGYFWRQSPSNMALHRFLMRPPRGRVVDHIDGNPANNRRENLRVCSQAQNNQNKGKQRNNASGYKGVFWDKTIGKWRPRVNINGRSEYIGVYDSAEEAARARDAKAIELFGEYAVLNFPPKLQQK